MIGNVTQNWEVKTKKAGIAPSLSHDRLFAGVLMSRPWCA